MDHPEVKAASKKASQPASDDGGRLGPRKSRMSVPMKHPDLIPPREEDEEHMDENGEVRFVIDQCDDEDEDEHSREDSEEERDDFFDDLYERVPRPHLVSDNDDEEEDDILKKFQKNRDRSRSLPAVHGHFHLLHRNWTTPQQLGMVNKTRRGGVMAGNTKER